MGGGCKLHATSEAAEFFALDAHAGPLKTLGQRALGSLVADAVQTIARPPLAQVADTLHADVAGVGLAVLDDGDVDNVSDCVAFLGDDG